MANLTYRQATQEAPVSTTTKNAVLTSQEIDGNFKSLNDELITKAPLVSPGFSGVPTAPTATAGTNTTQIATTSFVQTGLGTKAPLVSPGFSGVPTAPTATAGTNTTQIATTAFVQTGLGTKASLDSPGFSGVPTAPTATAGTNTTQIATTAYVFAERSNAAVLTNKTISGSNNTITNISLTNGVTDVLPVANGGTGVTISSGTGSVVLNSSPALTTPTIAGEREVRVAGGTGGSYAVNLATGNYFTRTFNAAATISVSNVPTSGTAQTFIFDITNAGAYTITWMAGIKWASGIAPTLTASGRDILGFFTHDGGTTWNGFLLAKDVK